MKCPQGAQLYLVLRDLTLPVTLVIDIISIDWVFLA